MPKALMRFHVGVQLIFGTPSGMPDVFSYSVLVKASAMRYLIVDESGERVTYRSWGGERQIGQTYACIFGHSPVV
jgi:hypothetical protein